MPHRPAAGGRYTARNAGHRVNCRTGSAARPAPFPCCHL